MTEDHSGAYIDAHVHVWTDDLQRYPLARPFTIRDMKPPVYSPEQIVREARPSGVDRVVLVQMSYYGFDNSFMLEAIKQAPQVFRGIAVVDGNGPAPDVQMRALAKFGVRGFRLYPDEVLLATRGREGFRKVFQCGAEERLAICLLTNPDALRDTDRQCEEFPDTPVVIDHLARIGMSGTIRDADVADLCRLARHPEVTVKVSAFYALGEAKPPHMDLVSLIRRVYEAYGPKRLMWGSDCPFQTVHESYEDSLSVIRDRLDFFSNDDKEWLLGKTAEQIFFAPRV